MKKGKLSKAASLFLSLMLVLTMVPSVGTDTAWAADNTSETTEAQPEISFRVCDRTIEPKIDLADTLKKLKPGQSLTKDCNVVEDTSSNDNYIASFAADGKTLLLNNYDKGAIQVCYTNELTLKLKGENTINQFENYGSNIATDNEFLAGRSESNGNQLNLTITSADSLSKGKLILKNEEALSTAVRDKDNELYGIIAKSLTLDNVDLELNLKNNEKRVGCYALRAGDGMTVKNSSTVNINIFDFVTEEKAAVYGLCCSGGTLKIEQSTVNVNFKNCTTGSGWGDLYGIAKYGGGTNENERDILISNSNVNIKAENVEQLTEDHPKSKYGIYCYDSKGKIKISDNSSVTIDGGNNKFGYGILDEAIVEKEYANCAGVIVDKNSNLGISNVIYGISSYKRGVDMIDAAVTVNADDTAVYGYFFDANNKNLGKYGLHVTGNSKVDLKACKNAVKVNADGVLQFAEGLIDLSEGGYLRMSITRNADDTLDNPTQAVGIITAEEVLNDAFRLGSNTAITSGAIRLHEDKSNEVYTAQSAAPTTLEDGQKKYELEFNYHNGNILKVNWNQDTNEVSWSDSSLLTKYELTLEGAENNGSKEPEYKGLKTIAEAYEGKSYTLPKNITDMMIPTMSYRIKVTPCTVNADWKTIDSMASYSNVKQATEAVGSLDLNKIGYWQIGWPAIENAHIYYNELKKYDDVTKKYETVRENSNISNLYDLRDALAATKDAEWWEDGSKYILSVTATAGGNKKNVLARGETTEPIVFGYNSLKGSPKSELNAKFTTKVVRRTGWQYFEWINGDDDTSNDFDPIKLLYGDEVTLTYKPSEGSTEKMNGWYVKSNIINMKTKEGTDSDGNKTLTFTMPLNSDVTAYPLLGTEEIKEAALEYDRSYSDNISKGRLAMVAKRFEHASSFKNYFSKISITWKDENGKSVGALSEQIDDTKNYVGTVELKPADGKYFAEGMTVSLKDSAAGSNAEFDIKNGKLVNGCYTFDLYLVNMPKITVPFGSDGTLQTDKPAAVAVNGKALYTAALGTVTTGTGGSGTISGASVTTIESGDDVVLFADTPQLMVNDNIYKAQLSFSGTAASVKSTAPIIIYPTPTSPVLNYPSGTTFYADSDTETEINVVKLDTEYLKTLKNPAAKINYSYKTSDGNTGSGNVAKDNPITFSMKGSTNVNSPKSVTLTVWVDNGPKTSYTYYTVDASPYGGYMYEPRLTPGSADFTDSLQVKLANPLPNIKYYYTTSEVDPTWDSTPEKWGTLREYTGSITVSTTTVIHLVGKNSAGQYTKPAKEKYSHYSSSEYMLKGTITSQGSASDPITVTLKQDGLTVDTQTVYGNSAAYSFRLTQSGAYQMEVSKKKHKTYTATVNVSSTSMRDVNLDYVSIGGTVTSSGDDNDDVTITLTGYYYNSGNPYKFTETLTGKGYSMAYCFDDIKIATNLEKVDKDSDISKCNTYTIEIKKPGHGTKTLTVDLNDEAVPYEWNVDLEQTSVKISGEISFSDISDISEATPTPGATVKFRENSTGSSKDVKASFTGDAISYKDTDFLEPNTDYTMTVSSDGYLTHTEVLHTGTKPMTKDITLTKATPSEEDTFAVSGKLITPGGRIEDAVEIALIPEGSEEAKYRQTVNDTEYIFTDVEQGTYNITAKKLGFIVGILDGDDAIKVDYEAVTCDIQLDPVKISGTVKTADDSKEITLTLTKDGEKSPKYTKTISTADFKADGDKYIAEYLFGGDGGTEVVEPGTYSLTATQAPAAEGEDSVSCTAKNIIVAYNDCTQNLDLTKPAGVTVSGTVTSWNANDDVVYLMYAGDTDDSVIRADWKANKTTDVLYTTWGSSITANTDGKRYDQAFSFSGIAAGTYKLAILKPGHGIWIETITVESSDISGKKITLYMYGDINGDGKVKSNDSSILAKYIAGWPGYETLPVYEAVADMNFDGKIKSNDSSIFAKHLAGWPGYEYLPVI